MKIKNDLVRIKVGKKKYDFHNLILNEYLRRFALAQTDKENTLKGKLTQSRELNYILLKLDTSLEITESSELYYNDFDICIINQAKHFQDLSENQITIQYDYKTKENTFVVDISVSSQATETTSGIIKFLNNFYGKKITAIGFSSGWAHWANYPVCAVLDTSNYNIYLEENQEFSVTRRDIITTDAEFYSNDKDKVPAPVHLAPYGVPQIINQPDIVDSEGTINSFYDNAYGALYSIGKGYMPNVIEEEKIIGEDAKVVNNGTSLTISSVENEDVGTEALYPSEDLYPIGKFTEEIQTSEKGIQVSLEGNEEDAFVKIDGKSTQATRILPEEYQQLEYIVSDGFQTIDTNYKPNNNTRIITKFQYASATTDNNQYNILFGILRPSISDVAYNIRQFDYGYTRASYNTSRDIILDQSLNNSNLHVVDFNKNLLYLDGNLLKTFNEGVFQANTNLFIFNDRKNIESTGKTGGKMKMYYFIIYENNNIIRNFIPCYRKSDNTIGLYDLINNSFYTNSNTAFIKDFTKGDNIQIPSPEFPSEIKSVGDEGTVTIEQRGKNKINPDKPSPSRTDGGITITNNGDGSYTAKGTSTKTLSIQLTSPNIIKLKANTYYTNSIEVLKGTMTGSIAVTVKKSDNTIGYNYINVNNSNKTNTQISVEDLTIYAYSFYCESGTKVDFTFRVQLEEGTEATDYEPYFSKDYVIPTTPLRSLPNGTKDTIEEDGIHRRVGSVVLDGSENWIFGTQYQPQYGNRFDVSLPNLPGAGSYEILCDYFKYIEPNRGGCWANISSKLELRIQTTMFSTVTELKTWLSNHNTEVLYELSEEVVEPFTDEQLEVINSIETQKGTNIFSVNNELNPEIQVTEYKSPLYPIKDNYKYIILKYKVWQEVATGEYTEEDGYIQEITDTGYYYHQAIPLEEYGTLNTTIKYERG